MTPKEAAIKDYQSGEVYTPRYHTHEQRTEYSEEYLAMIQREDAREAEEMRAGV